MKFKFIANSIATMRDQEVLQDTNGEKLIKKRTRRWIKVEVDQLKDLLALKDWEDINPREQDLTNKPSKAMKLTLTADKRDCFHYFNKGICIIAKDCEVKQIDGNYYEIILTLENKEEHGVCDGGHTLGILLECLKKAIIMGQKHVILEVLTGVEDIIFELSRHRNTNAQVKEKALADLEGKFDFLKEGMTNELFSNYIWWTENENKKYPHKDISINLVIQILTAFNNSISDKEAKKTYSGSTSCETKYINVFNQNQKNNGNQLDNVYYKLKPLYGDIFRFVDYITKRIPSIYNRIGYLNERGNFGNLRAINYKSDSYILLFTRENNSYAIPNPLIFPILAAMRQLYQEDSTGLFKWIINPIAVFDAIGDTLVTKIMSIYFDKNGFVNEIGKSPQIWTDTYQIVANYLENYLNQQRILELEKRLSQLERE